MVTLLFTSIVVLIILVVAVYFWPGPSAQARLEGLENRLPLPPTDHGGLFSDNSHSKDQKALSTTEPTEERKLLLRRASAGDHTAADEAHKNFDRKVYGEILTALVKHADSD